MRNPERIKPIISKIEKLWSDNPDLRFGQIVEIIRRIVEQEDIFYVEDEVVNMALDIWIGQDKRAKEDV